jgi:hypothetical protein
MIDLKIIKREVQIINYYDLDKFISEYYNKPKFNSAYQFEWINDSSYFFNIEKRKMDEYDYEHMFESPEGLFTDLCNSDIIKEGEYLIVVSW